MKRYSIVRVDDDYKHICPSAFEKVDDSSFCKLAIRKGGSCNVCPYGDTKEQLIRKIQQPLFKRFMATNSKFKGLKKKTIAKRLAHKMALEIVEFLGVE